ncbi:MAG: GYD domain-containing protein [Burkholderiaceae bacterium]
MFLASLTEQGMKGVAKDGGTSRQKAIGELIKSLGGQMESFRYAFGDFDVVAVAELPTHAAAAAASLMNQAAGLSKIRTIVLMEAADMDQASALAGKAVYRKPSG